jgi:hypothetical protein
LPTAGLPAGVRPLDLWSDDRYGSVLFWADRELDLFDRGHAALYLHHARQLRDGKWQSTGGGGYGAHEPQEIVADQPGGLHRFGGASHDSVRLTIGIATSDVAVIRLRDDRGRTRDRRPGADGFFLLGITYQDPITYAYAINSRGEELPGEPLLL